MLDMAPKLYIQSRGSWVSIRKDITSIKTDLFLALLVRPLHLTHTDIKVYGGRVYMNSSIFPVVNYMLPWEQTDNIH